VELKRKRGRFGEEQTLGILKEHKAGRKIAGLSREQAVSEGTLMAGRISNAGIGGGRSATDCGAGRIAPPIRCDTGAEPTSRLFLGCC
jgi:hypothetical protein